MKVLIADDSEAIRERLAELCAGIPGAQLLSSVASGDAALRQIELLQPEVVVTDLHMANGNGFELLEKTSSRFSDTVFVVFTSDTSAQTRARCMALGAGFYFAKSRDIRVLGETLQRLSKAKHNPGEYIAHE